MVSNFLFDDVGHGRLGSVCNHLNRVDELLALCLQNFELGLLGQFGKGDGVVRVFFLFLRGRPGSTGCG